MTTNWKSRKFLLTVGFFALVVANGIWQLGISEGMFYALAGMFGIYVSANAYQSASNSPNINIDQYTTRMLEVPYNGSGGLTEASE